MISQYIIVKNTYQDSDCIYVSYGIALAAVENGKIIVLETISDITASLECMEHLVKWDTKCFLFCNFNGSCNGR